MGLLSWLSRDKKTNKNNSINEFNDTELKDLRIYAFVRCLSEMMNIDGKMEIEELELLKNFSDKEQKKLSKPYNINSKEAVYVWGKNYKNMTSNRKNLITVLKTFSKKELEIFLEKIVVMAVVDYDLDDQESQYLCNLYAEIYDVSDEEALRMAGSQLRKLGLIE